MDKTRKEQVIDFLCLIAGNNSEYTLDFINYLINGEYIPVDDLEEYSTDFENYLKGEPIEFKPDLTSNYWTKKDFVAEEVPVTVCGRPYYLSDDDVEYESRTVIRDIEYSHKDEIDFLTNQYGRDTELLAAWLIYNMDTYDLIQGDDSWEEYLADEY